MSPTLTLIVPVFNEEDALPQAIPLLEGILKETGLPYEIIVIDNGSSDGTEGIAQGLAKQFAHLRYVRLSRNFGYQNSLSAAMSMAMGDAIISIDVDLQDPPELIHEFVKHWQAGYDIVYGVREQRTGERASRIWATQLALRFIRLMSDHPIPERSGDFRLISRKVRDAFIELPENNRYLRGMIHWLGFKQIGIPYTRQGRQFGADTHGSSNNLWRLLLVVADAILSFSMKPLRFFFFLGIIILALVLLAVFVYTALAILGNPPRGFTTLILVSLAHLGLTSIGFGILGEYIGRIYTEAKRRPLWLVDYTLNFDQPLTFAAHQENEVNHA